MKKSTVMIFSLRLLYVILSGQLSHLRTIVILFLRFILLALLCPSYFSTQPPIYQFCGCD